MAALGGSALPSGRPATTGRPATALGARVLTPAASKVANSTAPAHTQAPSPTTGSDLFRRVCPAPVPSTFRGCHTGRRRPTPRCGWDLCRRSRMARCASASARSGTRTIQCRTKVRNSGNTRCFLATLRRTKTRDRLHSTLVCSVYIVCRDVGFCVPGRVLKIDYIKDTLVRKIDYIKDTLAPHRPRPPLPPLRTCRPRP